MNNMPRISESEFEIMKVVWNNKDPVPASDIIEKVAQKNSWNPRTVKSLINRLTNKGALEFEQKGKMYLYFPAVSKEDCVAEESESFLDRMFDGALMPMLTHFAKSKKLSRADIEKLRQMLDNEEEK